MSRHYLVSASITRAFALRNDTYHQRTHASSTMLLHSCLGTPVPRGIAGYSRTAKKQGNKASYTRNCTVVRSGTEVHVWL